MWDAIAGSRELDATLLLLFQVQYHTKHTYFIAFEVVAKS